MSLGPDWIVVCSRPPAYDCVITPRFPEVVSILIEERESFEG
jgi:hypothetical protein